MPSGTSPFDKRTLRQRCTAHIREQVIYGKLAPGEHLKETVLAEEFGVSRGTLREALRPLEIEGLLVDDGRGHLHVRATNAAEIIEVFQVRAALETLAATMLVARSDRAELAALLAEALEPLRDDELEFAAQIAVDLGFHQRLCELTGNETLVRSWKQLVGQIEMMIIAAGPSRAHDRMRYAEHAVLCDAIASGDEATARNALQEHMDRFASAYLSDLPRVSAR